MSASRSPTGDAILCLAVAGTLALTLLLGRLDAPVDVERFELLEYLLLGSVFPLLSFVPAWAAATGRSRLQAAFAVAGAAAVAFFVVRVPHPAAIPAALVQAGATRLLRRRESGGDARAAVLELFVVAAAWNAALGLASARALAPATVEGLLASGRLAPWIALPVGMGVVVAAVVERHGPTPERSFPFATALALVVMAVASLRVGYLFDAGTIYHWGVFVGPAELVRLGGWLLWDVPAQYGFLTTATIAAVPSASVWDAFFRLNAVALFVSALLLFLHYRALGDRPVHLIAAVLVSMSAVFWIPGVLGRDGFAAPLTTPSGGPFRFVWWLVLMTVLRLATERQRACRSMRSLLVGGSVLWLVGSLWSVESAVWCSASWLPAYALMVWLEHRRGPALRLLAVPPLFAAAAVASIAAYYHLRLGHGPDWWGFIEYATSYAGGHGAVATDPRGPVWVLVLAFAIVSAAIVTAAARAPLHELVPLVGAWAGLWAIASYFVDRSVAVTVASLVPVVCTVLALVLQAQPRPRVPAAACTALLAVVVTLGLANGRWTNRYSWSVGAQYGWSVDERRPPMPPEEASALRGTLRPDDAIVFLDQSIPPRLRGEELLPWLPTFPFANFNALPDARRRLYVTRFVARAQRGGWLAESKAPNYLPMPWHGWFAEHLRRTHEARQMVETPRWRLTWFEYRAGR